MEKSEKKPWLFAYSTLLPLIWVSLSFIVSVVAPQWQMGVLGTLIVLFGTMYAIGWMVFRRCERALFPEEEVRLFVYLLFWSLLLESIILFGMFSQNPGSATGAWLDTVVFTVVLQALYVGLAVRFLGRRVTEFFLERKQRAEYIG